MGVKIITKSKQVNIGVLRTGDLFLYDGKVYIMTDRYAGDYMHTNDRIFVCIEDGKCLTARETFVSNLRFEPISNAYLEINCTLG